MPAVPQSCGPNQNAERLKSEGNAFHVNGQYRAAYKKYSEAIKEDPKNAVYYANRAASNLAMKEYMDAASDAEKATKLDPTYAKAWGRLASARFALSTWTSSAEAYRTALSCLPKDAENATSADKTLQKQFLDGLRKAEKEKENATFKGTSIKPGALPWERAASLTEELAEAQKLSSAFVIHFAYNDFKEGVAIMKALERKYTNGNTMWIGKPDVLANMSNAIMRDARVFHFDCADWVEKYNEQVLFECTKTKAWSKGGAKVVMEEAPQRLRREGWGSLRPALSVTVRAWIMCGFMAKSNARELVALEYYSRALEVLEWGRRKWENVPTSDRGVIFEMTFIRGVKRLRLIALHECLAKKITDCQYTREDAAEWSRDIIAEVEANPPGINAELDAGFLPSFWMYPKADALTILGWYHMQLGLQANSKEEAYANFDQSAKYYLEAVHNFLDDDEYVLIYLAVVFEAYMFQGKPLRELLIVIAKMDGVLPNVMKIWENSPLKDARDPQIHGILEFGYECMARVKAGNLSLDAIVEPKSMKRNDKWKTSNVIYI